MRVVRFPISQDSYECIITNLPQEKFSSGEIKQLYAKRWGIETPFRELKYALGLTRFHAKKPEYIVQGIWPRMTLYNFCGIIATNVVVKQKVGCKYIYQLNYTRAMRICCHFLSIKEEKAPPDVHMQQWRLHVQKIIVFFGPKCESMIPTTTLPTPPNSAATVIIIIAICCG